MRTCYVIQFDNPVTYANGLKLQKQAFDIVRSGRADGILLMLQHSPVFTIGSNGGVENLLVQPDVLSSMGIEICYTSRGGNITYHGPGQLVVYPIMNLNSFVKDTHWYLRQLETAVIKSLEAFGLEGKRKEKYTGVWIGDNKIAAIGVHVKKWITMHGLSLNLHVNKEHFGLINPCGIVEFGVASLNEYCETVEDQMIINKVRDTFGDIFDMRLIQKDAFFLGEQIL
ncbi:lipoyl(octanoyl) transferase LipB [Acidaminobacter hydrogenoformans]|nr:lipoyl(octanoyl) transferase LipB [Acidaminobacter hydrogenoformans]